jgi:arginase
MTTTITAFQGHAGDRNDLGIPGALALATGIADRLGLPLDRVGQPAPALNLGWASELEAAAPDLASLAEHITSQLRASVKPITILNRCAAAIATVPRVVEQHPKTCVLWLDAHADLNTPESSSSGYLGGLALSGPAGLWDSGFGNTLDLKNIVLVGSRDLDPFELELITSGKVQLVRADAPNLLQAVIDAIADRPVYIHLDCDVLEPGLVPTDFRVDGGLSFQSLHAIASALAKTPIVGLEIAEFQCAWAPGMAPVSPAELIDALEPLLNAIAGA